MIRLGLVIAAMLTACAPANGALVSAADIDGDRLERPLTQDAGDPQRGQAVFIAREQGHCVLCHVVENLDVEFQGNVGPTLTSVADRLDPAQLRLRVVDYQIVRPGTLMPSYYRIHDLYQVGEHFQNAPVLSAQDVEDVVAYLGTLKTTTDYE
ncbi:MAG: sulfur oxidation c-type cytochrome SoxX [Pseudomonadota bacterium]